MENISKLNVGTIRVINVENNDFETFAKDALEQFGCTDMTPYNTYLAKLIHDSEKFSPYKFIIVGKQLFQIGNVIDYTQSGLIMMAPGDHNGYFTFVAGTHEGEDMYDLLKEYLIQVFNNVKDLIDTNEIVKKWIDECPEESQKHMSRLYERLQNINNE